MRRFGTVAIVGPGLIGSSLGLAMKRRGLTARVIGISRTAATLATAKRIGAIDEGSRDIGAVRDADLIVLCLPVEGILRLAPAIVKLAKNDCVICDAGSTKAEIVRRFGALTRRFVGCHPMAGSEKRGPAHANAHLFDSSLCIITPGPRTDRDALARVKNLWVAVCRKLVTMPAREHDRVIAAVSHLPHAAAFALVNTVPQDLLAFSARGFRDTTRLAASHEELWENIFLTNRGPVAGWIGKLEKNLGRIRKAVAANDAAGLRKLLRSARKARERLAQ
jgi:prephenate dehydrogenase